MNESGPPQPICPRQARRTPSSSQTRRAPSWRSRMCCWAACDPNKQTHSAYWLATGRYFMHRLSGVQPSASAFASLRRMQTTIKVGLTTRPCYGQNWRATGKWVFRCVGRIWREVARRHGLDSAHCCPPAPVHAAQMTVGRKLEAAGQPKSPR